MVLSMSFTREFARSRSKSAVLSRPCLWQQLGFCCPTRLDLFARPLLCKLCNPHGRLDQWVPLPASPVWVHRAFDAAEGLLESEIPASWLLLTSGLWEAWLWPSVPLVAFLRQSQASSATSFYTSTHNRVGAEWRECVTHCRDFLVSPCSHTSPLASHSSPRTQTLLGEMTVSKAGVSGLLWQRRLCLIHVVLVWGPSSPCPLQSPSAHVCLVVVKDFLMQSIISECWNSSPEFQNSHTVSASLVTLPVMNHKKQIGWHKQERN